MSSRRKEEGERGQAQQPRRRRVAGGCRQEAGDRTGLECYPLEEQHPPEPGRSASGQARMCL